MFFCCEHNNALLSDFQKIKTVTALFPKIETRQTINSKKKTPNSRSIYAHIVIVFKIIH